MIELYQVTLFHLQAYLFAALIVSLLAVSIVSFRKNRDWISMMFVVASVLGCIATVGHAIETSMIYAEIKKREATDASFTFNGWIHYSILKFQSLAFVIGIVASIGYCTTNWRRDSQEVQ